MGLGTGTSAEYNLVVTRVESGSGHGGEGRRGEGEAWQSPRRQVMERRLPKGGELTAGKPHGS